MCVIVTPIGVGFGEVCLGNAKKQGFFAKASLFPKHTLYPNEYVKWDI